MFELSSVESLLGVNTKHAESTLGLARSIEQGLPIAAVDKVARCVAPDSTRIFTYKVVPKATFERRRQKKERLTTQEGDKLARVAKVFVFGMSIFRDHEKVRDFLTRPHMMLENEAPIDVALSTGAGADAVINLLGRAAYGGGV
jgi:putative toxin-antitoxin system antitoxin component (TIGR02293 family)